jgi:CheY-like chemotaxis protein
MGADDYLTKPFDLAVLFDTIKKVLADAERDCLPAEKVDFSGNLEELNIEDIVQLIEINEKTGELNYEIPPAAICGSIFFKTGNVAHAMAGNLQGEEAFYELATIKNGYAKFISRETDVSESISSQTMALLFEAARMEDEAGAVSHLLDGQDKTLRLKSSKIPADIKENLDIDWVLTITAMIQAGKTVSEIMDGSGMSRVRAQHILAELIKAGVVEANESKEARPEMPSLVDETLVSRFREIQVDRLTGVLTVTGRDVNISIHFDNGRIDQAFHGNTRGKKALFRILAEKGGEIDFNPQQIDAENAIQSDMASLINAANVEIAYKKKLTAEKLAGQVSVMTDAWSKISRHKKTIELSDIMLIASEGKTLKDILDASELTDLKTLNQLVYLKKIGAIHIGKA